MPNPVVHWEIAGTDGPRIQKFYRELFDWKMNVMDNMGGYGLVDTEAGGINGGVFAGPKGHPFLTFYVQVDDLQAYLDKATKLGGQAVVPPTPIPGIGSYAFLKDPDGNIVGIFKP